MIKLTIEGTQILDTPRGWENIGGNIVREFEERTLRITYPTELTFYGDGYAYL